MIKGKHFVLQQQDGPFLPTLLKAGPVGQSKHQRRPRDLGVSGQEVGTKCSEDTKDEIRQQCIFSPTHLTPLAQGFSNSGDGPSFQTLSRNLFSLIPPLGCKRPQAGCTPASHSFDFSFCLQRYERQARLPALHSCIYRKECQETGSIQTHFSLRTSRTSDIAPQPKDWDRQTRWCTTGENRLLETAGRGGRP